MADVNKSTISTKTNLSEVKNVLKILFDSFSTEPEGEYGIVSHPFTNSIAIPVKNSGSLPINGTGYRLGDIRNPEDKKIWRNEWFQKIDELSLKDLESFFYISINKPYLLTCLMFIKPYIKNSLFSYLLADAWVRSENPNGDANVDITTLIQWFKDADKTKIMEADDFKYYNALPEYITVYRGVARGRNPKGLSWTDSKEKAEWFRDRWKSYDKNKDRYLLSATIPREYALCYFNTRFEQEIVVDSDALWNDKSIKISREDV